MNAPRDAVESAFDARATNYDDNDWHVRYAERLVSLATPTVGMTVLDAACGTGLATTAVARAVGESGRVVGVDISSGMLRRAIATIQAAGLRNIELIRADATDLARFPDESFDLVLCSAGLLYLPVDVALREWYRLLRDGGVVGFSTMREGAPPAARLFREQAADHGLELADPATPLGSEDRCRRVLTDAGFEPERTVGERVRFTGQDLRYAWESHVRGPHHEAVRTLEGTRLAAFERTYTRTLARLLADDPASVCEADVIYAFGRKNGNAP